MTIFSQPLRELSAQHIIAVDVGNSRVKFGLFHSIVLASAEATLWCHRDLAVPHTDEIPWQEIRGWVKDGEVPGGLIAGTSPQRVEQVLQQWPADWPAPVEVKNTTDFPLQIDVAEPRKVGVDRLLNAAAARFLRTSETPVVIVDSGTATTLEVIDSAGTFVGGAILAGFDLSAKSLHDYTALLPYIPPAEFENETPAMPGRNTREAIANGLYWGQVGAVKELVAQATLQCETPPQVMLAGGGSDLLVPHFPNARHLPHLVLQGLVLVGGSSL